MTTRWKLMAGLLGVSLAGLAGFAGQCPRPDGGKARRADDAPVFPDLPKVPGGGVTPSQPAPPPVDVPPPTPASLPPLPDVAAAPKLPPVPPPSPSKADAKKPEVAKKPEPTPLPTLPPAFVVPAGGQLPATPPAPALPADLPKPSAPAVALPVAAPAAVLEVPAFGPAPIALPAVVTPLPDAAKSTEPKGTTVGLTPAAPPAPAEFAAPAAVTPVAAAVAVPSKFRIVLRVGEGEPVFEVRHNDDLVLKVMSDKVDVKSPEKGGLSAVTATGKVRFVGFGSEGTCDSLSFLAGTGEVALSGAVKVQVKDKIGRVESELTADQMKYKIDTTTLPGSIKP